MNHQEATEQMAVEKYLLDELAPPARDQFEEHFFGCPACAAELRTTAAFLGVAKGQLSAAPAARTAPAAPRPARKSWFEFLWSPAFAAPAFAVLLAIIGYQNLVIGPRMTGELAQLRSPEIVPSVSLMNSRAGGTPTLAVSATQSFLLPIDIPTVDHYASYSCELVGPSGSTAWRLPVSADEAKNTVSVRVPAGARESGTYTLIVKGYSDSGRGEPVEVTRYRFALTTSN